MDLRARLARAGWKRILLVGAGGGFLVLVLACLLAYVFTTVPTANALSRGGATQVLYSDGSPLGRIGSTNRILVPLSRVPLPVQRAVLAAEDRQFYTEPGISPRGIARAVLANLRGGGVSQGGSTITQQYAKNAYLTQKRTFTRKIQEIFISLKLAQTRSKSRILEDYLNTIYYGRGAYGIEAASRAYFNKHVEELSAAEGAVLAASIRAPSLYDPTRHHDRAVARWNYVLGGMVKSGWLSASARPTAYPAVLKSATDSGSGTSGATGYILDQVKEELQRNGFAEDMLVAGGFTVQTTIRKQFEDAAIRAIQSRVSNPGNDQGAVQAALVAVKPGTGEVFAYYGGAQGSGSYDYASAGLRPPGSSMKPYTLATALSQGISLDTRVNGSSPQTIAGQLIRNDQGDPPLGQVDLVTATKLSVNTAFYNLADKVGADAIARTAHAAGIPDAVPLYNPADHNGNHPTLGITLGVYGVHVIDQAAGYATFAAQGGRADPFFVKSVQDRHHDTVYSGKVATRRAFGADVAADATYAMQQVVASGTGTRAQLAGRPTAGKTGTTSENKDAWFCGFTPQIAAAVWLGRGNDKPLAGVLGVSGGVYGGTVPAAIFKDFLDQALQGQPVENFPPRANVGQVSAPSTASAAPTTAAPSSTPSKAPVLPTSLPTIVIGSSPTPTPQQTSSAPSPPPSQPAPSSPPASKAAKSGTSPGP